MCEELRLERYDNSPWGFRLTGGLDFGTPLSIIKVTGGSIAEEAGVQAGDLLKNINGKPTTHFTHLDAQKCIASSGNYLTITVLRGSVVTPPVTPLRGLSPAPSYKPDDLECPHDSPTIMKSDIENEIMDYYNREVDLRNGPRSPVTVHQKPIGQKAIITNNKTQYRVNDEGQLLLGDRALTDFEIAELLSSNEEVLDQGILGINFKKFLPKVDFIRNSEVFKMLQSENTKKDISEQAQLQKEPSKRFSTFLMKPRTPNEPPIQLSFVKFKPPRYLPRQPDKKWELPKLRPWERPKKKDPEHSVLWLFMEEKGEEIIDERWGTEEEERQNLSRNSFLEYDRSSMSSSMRMHEDDTCSVTSRDKYEQECRASVDEENKRKEEHLYEKYSEDVHERNKVIKKPKFVFDTDKHEQENIENKEQCTESIMEQEDTEVQTIKDEAMAREERVKSERVVDAKLVQQLSEIQNQIEALENDAPSDLQTQLLAVKEQLSKIVQIKTSLQEMKKVEQCHEEKISEESYSTSTEQVMSTTEYYSEKHEEIESKNEYSFGTKSSSAQESVGHEIMRKPILQEESATQKSEFVEQKSEKHIEVSTYQVEELEETEFQLCFAPSPKPPPKKKSPAHPITPQLRPIVLPGGRMWRQPKDAEHEEFYQGILVAQAEVLVGTNVSLNYTKYMPPKVDMTTSDVYQLIHEIEEGNSGVKENENENYCQPISKRHFYAATLREPPPIGVVELSDL